MTRTTARMHVERKGALQEHVHSGRSSGAVDSDSILYIFTYIHALSLSLSLHMYDKYV